MEDRIQVGPLLAAMRELFVIAVKPLVIYVGAMTAVFTLMDVVQASNGHFTLNSIGSSVGGYLLMRALALETGLADEGRTAGFGSYFGMGLLEGLAYLFGALLLLVPAIILMVRWTPSIPLMMCERRRVTEAMELSWKATKGSFWPLFGPTLFGGVLFVLAILAGDAVIGDADLLTARGIVGSVTTNFCITIMSAYYALLALATYRLLCRPHEGLAEVFA